MTERLASIQHNIWSHWMIYLFSQGVNNPDGTFTIPAEKVQRWKRQMMTDYDSLSESEKKSDIGIVENFILSDEKINEAIRKAISI